MNTTPEAMNEPHKTETDRLLADMSAMLLRTDGDDMAARAEEALRRIGQSLELDRCTVIACTGESTAPAATAHWTRTEATGDAADDVVPLRALVDHWRHDAEVIVLERIPEDFPVAALADIPDHLKSRMTMRSAVAVRVIVPVTDGALTCALIAGTLAERRAWPAPVLQRLQIATEMLA